MYNVSEEYLEKINSVSREISWYGTVTLTNGTVYTFTPDNLKQGQTSVSRQLCSDRKIEIGCVCSAELKIAFMLDYDGTTYSLNGISVDRYDFYDAEIDLYFRLYLDEGYENLKVGSFIVSEPERDQSTLICTAYDYMQKFSKPCVSTIQNTPYNVLLSACVICGVELGNTRPQITSMANGQNTCAMYDPNGNIQTWRDVIGYIASMLGGNAVIKADNKLYIIPFNTTPVRIISGSERVRLTLEDYKTNYNILTAVNARANITETVKVADTGLTYALGTNPLIQYVTTAARQTTYINILDVLHEMDYTPFSGSFFCDPSFEIGDVVVFNENHAMDGTKSIVTKITLNIGGHMEMACEGDNPYRQKAEEAATDKTSETSGSVGDGVTFFDYINTSSVSVPENTETQIISIGYDSNGKYRHEFASEVMLTVATTETEEETTFTENDCQVLVKYYINGQEESYHPQYVFTDGVYLLHLMYIWESDIRVASSTFRVTLTLTGGTASIATKNIFSRIMQSGEAYVAPSNDLEYIVADPLPTKKEYKPQEIIDYTGLMIRAYYEDGHYENVTSQCTIVPVDGTQITQNKDVVVRVTYIKDNIPFYTEFDLIVRYLLALDVKKDPTKTEYYVGDAIDLSGLKINAEYSDGTKSNVTNKCTYSPADGTVITSAGSITVIASYTDHGITKTANIILSAQEVVLEGIEVTTPPTKNTYYGAYEVDHSHGSNQREDTTDYSGIVVSAKFSNGMTEDVTAQCTFNPPNNTSILLETGETFNVNISYLTSGQTYTNQLSYEVVSPGRFLKYFDSEPVFYPEDGYILHIYKLLPEEVTNDGLTSLEIQSSYTDPLTGHIYTTQLGGNGTFANMSYGEYSSDCEIIFPNPNDIRFYGVTFANSIYLNRPISIISAMTFLDGVFEGCTNFNQPVTIGSSATSCVNMFKGCTSFNQPIHIGSSVTSCYEMLRGCTSFNSEITIDSGGNNVSVYGMLWGCNHFNRDLYFPSRAYGYTPGFEEQGILSGCNTYKGYISVPSIGDPNHIGLPKLISTEGATLYSRNSGKEWVIEPDSINPGHYRWHLVE